LDKDQIEDKPDPKKISTGSRSNFYGYVFLLGYHAPIIVQNVIITTFFTGEEKDKTQ